MIQPRKEVLLNAVTATAVSRGVGVDNAGGLSLMIFASGISTGNGTFSVEVSNDQANGYVIYNRATSNVTNTNAQNDTRVASLVQSTNATAMLFFPAGDTFNYVRVRCNVATDGAYSAVLYVN